MRESRRLTVLVLLVTAVAGAFAGTSIRRAAQAQAGADARYRIDAATAHRDHLPVLPTRVRDATFRMYRQKYGNGLRRPLHSEGFRPHRHDDRPGELGRIRKAWSCSERQICRIPLLADKGAFLGFQSELVSGSARSRFR